MTHATISFKAELSERLGAPDGATPPADILSGSLRVILELLLNAAQHLVQLCSADVSATWQELVHVDV